MIKAIPNEQTDVQTKHKCMKQSGFIVFLEIKKAMNNQELDDRFEFYSQIF